jgi:hypothetical protein
VTLFDYATLAAALAVIVVGNGLFVWGRPFWRR